MNLVEYDKDKYLNMDIIESVGIYDGKYKAFVIGFTESYSISEKAYNTILIYGKAKPTSV